MSDSGSRQPTEAELTIMRVLWREGPCTVREVHEELGGDESTRYTTTLKQLQVMTEKGFVRRDESQRSHVYSPTNEEAETEQSLVSSFVDRMFQGSVNKMLIQALESSKVSAEELAEIKRQLQQWERRK